MLPSSASARTTLSSSKTAFLPEEYAKETATRVVCRSRPSARCAFMGAAVTGFVRGLRFQRTQQTTEEIMRLLLDIVRFDLIVGSRPASKRGSRVPPLSVAVSSEPARACVPSPRPPFSAARPSNFDRTAPTMLVGKRQITKEETGDRVRLSALNMYSTPPEEQISLTEFEDFAFDRLRRAPPLFASCCHALPCAHAASTSHILLVLVSRPRLRSAHHD